MSQVHRTLRVAPSDEDVLGVVPARHWLRGLCEPDLLEATDF